MAKNIHKIAAKLGATVVAEVPDTGGGAFGAARIVQAVATLQTRLTPGQGVRPGRPTVPGWVESPKVPMSEITFQRLTKLAEQASECGRKVSPMQVAAQLLEEAVAVLPINSQGITCNVNAPT